MFALRGRDGFGRSGSPTLLHEQVSEAMMHARLSRHSVTVRCRQFEATLQRPDPAVHVPSNPRAGSIVQLQIT
jgi:hypothetical protein